MKSKLVDWMIIFICSSLNCKEEIEKEKKVVKTLKGYTFKQLLHVFIVQLIAYRSSKTLECLGLLQKAIYDRYSFLYNSNKLVFFYYYLEAFLLLVLHNIIKGNIHCWNTLDNWLLSISNIMPISFFWNTFKLERVVSVSLITEIRYDYEDNRNQLFKNRRK